MPRFKLRGVLDRDPVADLWRHTLNKIPTTYGRLTYLADLRDPRTGVYQHHGLAATFGREEAKRALAESHLQVFSEWLALPLLKTAGSTKAGDEIYQEISYPVAHRLITKCDAILRIPGASKGADNDVKLAQELGLTVYYRLEDKISN